MSWHSLGYDVGIPYTCAGYLRHPFKKRERANLRSRKSREDPHTTKETDDILSFYERRKTEEKVKKTPVS